MKYRKLVQPGFSPSRLKQLEPHVRQLARTLAADIDTGNLVDFVDAFAARLPLLVIAEMLGVPASDRAQFQRWSD